MFCPLRLNLRTRPANACHHHNASKIRLLCQFAFEDSQEMVWPERKQCSAKADLCECLFSTAF